MARRRWFYSRGDTQHGPFKGREILALVQSGEIHPSDTLWRNGMARPRRAGSYRKLFRRSASPRTRHWVVATAAISMLGVLFALLLGPGSEWTEMVPEHLRGFCLLGSIACGLLALVAPGICAISIESTFVDIPVTAEQQAKKRRWQAVEPAPEPVRPSGEPSPWAAPAAMSWMGDAAREFAAPAKRRRRTAWHGPLYRPDRRTLASAAAGLVALAAGFAIWPRGPFRYAPATGSVAYADGSLLRLEQFRLTFHPLARPAGAATRPPLGTAVVDGATGSFTAASADGAWSGIVAGRHKVTVHAADGSPLPQHLLGPEYADPATTLLTADTATQPLTLRLQKP